MTDAFRHDVAPNLHPLLAAALGALAEDGRPTGPFHLDGPRPSLSIEDAAALATWAARQVASHASRAQRSEVERLLGLVERTLASPPTTREDPRWVDLRGARTIREHARGVLKIAALATEVMVEDPLRGMARASDAIERVVRMLASDDERRAFVAELDRRIVLAEAIVLAQRAKLDLEVARVVRRDEGPSVWVADAHGQCARIERGPKRRWQGTRVELPSPPAATPEPAERFAHPRFGEGVVLSRRPGPPPQIEVRFADGTRWLVERERS